MFRFTSTMRAACRSTAARPSYHPIVQNSVVVPRLFSTHPCLQVKEDANRSPEELEKTKQEHLQKQKDGKGQWEESLASSGEANIAADKDDISHHGDHIEELQKQTAGKAEQEHPEGKA